MKFRTKEYFILTNLNTQLNGYKNFCRYQCPAWAYFFSLLDLTQSQVFFFFFDLTQLGLNFLKKLFSDHIRPDSSRCW